MKAYLYLFARHEVCVADAWYMNTGFITKYSQYINRDVYLNPRNLYQF